MAYKKTHRVTLARSTAAIVIAAISYLALLFLQQRYGDRLAYRDGFFANWTEYVCVLLGFWALCILFMKWRRSVRRAQCIADSPTPHADSFESEDGAFKVIAEFKEAGMQCGEDLVSTRVEALIDAFRLTHDPAAVAATLNTQTELAQADLDSSYAPVRVFAWTIPVLGFIGTIVALGQATARFAALIATGTQDANQISTALTRATTDLGFAFETTLVAVLLALIVTVTYLVLHNHEKAILNALDDLCRSRLLPLMRKPAPQPAIETFPKRDLSSWLEVPACGRPGGPDPPVSGKEPSQAGPSRTRSTRPAGRGFAERCL